MSEQIEKLKSDVRWLEDALNAAGIDRDKQLRKIAEQQAEIERLREVIKRYERGMQFGGAALEGKS